MNLNRIRQYKVKQYIYIVQQAVRPSECIIGMTEDTARRLKVFNDNEEGKVYRYLFVCEVEDMVEILNDLREEFFTYRLPVEDELYFLNDDLFKIYIDYLKAHPMFEDVIFVKKNAFV